MKCCAAFDLHSNNACLGILDKNGKKIFKKKLPTDLPTILKAIEPFKEKIDAVAVESTYNWYWLVDGLMENEYDVCLANPAAMEQYSGLKYSEDFSDAFFLARLLQMNILETGYIYPKEARGLRDLLRKRLQLLRQRTAHILSFQGMVSRVLGKQMTGNEVKKLSEVDVDEIFTDIHVALAGKANIASMKFLADRITILEKEIQKKVKLKDEYIKLTTTPGIGNILATTIMLEVGDIGRFKTPGNYVSYCRCVNSKKMSNGKKKGTGNKKNGNKYLSWAYVEAANFAVRYSPEIKRYYERKKTKTKTVVAIKAVAHKIARANFYMLKDNEEFDVTKAFC